MEKTPSVFYDVRARHNTFKNPKNVMQNLSVAKQTSVLCLLPFDIRTLIYQLVLCSEDVLEIGHKVPVRYYPLQPDLIELGTKDVTCGLLQTCRLFHREATHLLYSGNTFSISGYNLESFLYGLLDTISQYNAAAIRTLNVDFDKEMLAHLACCIAADGNPLSQALESLPGLQDLVVRRPYNDFKLVYSCRDSPDARLDTFLEDSRLWTYRLLTAALQDARDGLPIEKISTCRLFIESKDEYVRLVLNDTAAALRMDVRFPQISDQPS